MRERAEEIDFLEKLSNSISIVLVGAMDPGGGGHGGAMHPDKDRLGGAIQHADIGIILSSHSAILKEQHSSSHIIGAG